MSRKFFPKLLVKIGNSTLKSLSEDPNVEVATRAVDMDSRARLLCYPRGSFYPLSPALPMKRQGIIKTYFRTSSGHSPRYQAGLNFCALPTISIRSKPTFVPLRCLLAGYRPSKTAQQALSPLSFSNKSG